MKTLSVLLNVVLAFVIVVVVAISDSNTRVVTDCRHAKWTFEASRTCIRQGENPALCEMIDQAAHELGKRCALGLGDSYVSK